MFAVRPRLSGGGGGIHGNSDELLEMSVTVGDDVTLPCEVESVPPPIITWAKDKQLISPFSPRYHIDVFLHSLTDFGVVTLDLIINEKYRYLIFKDM